MVDAKFAQISRNLAALEETAVPEWLRDVVRAARLASFTVLQAGELVVFYAPGAADGESVAEPRAEPSRLGLNLRRERLLERLAKLSLPLLKVPLGWSQPAVLQSDGTLIPAWAHQEPTPDVVG